MENNSDAIEINRKKLLMLEQYESNSNDIAHKQQVFIVGSKGIPAAYGGFETFVEKLTEYQVNDKIQYHVSCIGDNSTQHEYNGAKCFNVKVPNIGSAKAIYYDIAALKFCIDYCKARPTIKSPIFYVLACRIGPFIGHYKKKIEKLGGVLCVNPDGHEWKRAKWNVLIRRYWKISEKYMVKHADILICDSKNIEKYIQEEYKGYQPKTKFIAYGSDIKPSVIKDDDVAYKKWLENKGLAANKYYLVVGRFVPENNFETMISEFLKSKTDKDFAIVTTANDRFLEELEGRLHFKKDKRIKFVGTVYDQELLKKIRENAYGYLHGHEVGGTNPSLLEALGSTQLNMLLDVGFNREVGEDATLYWSKSEGDLTELISIADQMDSSEIAELGIKAKNRIAKAYSWEHIVAEYERVFLKYFK